MHPDYPCNWQAGVNIKFCKRCHKSAIDRVLFQ
nr:MAG TPA_asm: Cytochrome C' [Caudoviricetes sp.]